MSKLYVLTNLRLVKKGKVYALRRTFPLGWYDFSDKCYRTKFYSGDSVWDIKNVLKTIRERKLA